MRDATEYADDWLGDDEARRKMLLAFWVSCFYWFFQGMLCLLVVGCQGQIQNSCSVTSHNVHVKRQSGNCFTLEACYYPHNNKSPEMNFTKFLKRRWICWSVSSFICALRRRNWISSINWNKTTSYGQKKWTSYLRILKLVRLSCTHIWR